jgi:hypothetical protein
LEYVVEESDPKRIRKGTPLEQVETSDPKRIRKETPECPIHEADTAPKLCNDVPHPGSSKGTPLEQVESGITTSAGYQELIETSDPKRIRKEISECPIHEADTAPKLCNDVPHPGSSKGTPLELTTSAGKHMTFGRIVVSLKLYQVRKQMEVKILG